jgi:hypothetical protein
MPLLTKVDAFSEKARSTLCAEFLSRGSVGIAAKRMRHRTSVIRFQANLKMKKDCNNAIVAGYFVAPFEDFNFFHVEIQPTSTKPFDV